MPSKSPTVIPTRYPSLTPSVQPTDQPSMQNCDHLIGTEEVIECLKLELNEVNDIVSDLKTDLDALSVDVNGRCEAAYERLENSLNTCGAETP